MADTVVTNREEIRKAKYRETHLRKNTTEYLREYDAKNPEKVRERWRRYDARHPDKRIALSREYRLRHPGKATAEARIQRALYPERVSARKKLYYAVKVGKIVRPDACESCGKQCKPQAHHTDYAKPLEVSWLCASCHKKQHLGG
jgi:hypothetical protein